MHEEFQSLLDIYRSSDPKNTQRRKLDTIAIMVQLLTDVPKWKVPAAPSLVTDSISLARMVGQSETFFKEVLFLPLLKKPIPSTITGLKQKKAVKYVPINLDKAIHYVSIKRLPEGQLPEEQDDN